LTQVLSDENLSVEEYAQILEKIRQLDQEYLDTKEAGWKKTLDNISQYTKQLFSGMGFDFEFKGDQGRQEVVDDLSDQFVDNASSLASKGLGAFADTLLPGIGGIVEDATKMLLDIFKDDNWADKVDAWLEGYDKGVEKFWAAIERLLSNFPQFAKKLFQKGLETTGNLLGEILEWLVNSIIDFLNWAFGWLGVDLDRVDWGWKDDDTSSDGSKDNGDTDSGTSVTYGNITGPLADRFDQLIEALTVWDQLPGLLDGIRLPINSMSQDVAAIRQILSNLQLNGSTPSGEGGGNSVVLQFGAGSVTFLWEDVKDQSMQQFFDPLIQDAIKEVDF
jgi:hypothetical protein